MDSGAVPGMETQQEADSGCGEARDLTGILRDMSRGQLVIDPGMGHVGGLPGGRVSCLLSDSRPVLLRAWSTMDHQHPYCLGLWLTLNSWALSCERGCNMVAHGPLYRWVLFGLPCVSICGIFFLKS